MFTADTIIDTVKNGQKQFINTVVTNEALAKPLTNFVDAQAAFMQQAVASATMFKTAITDEVSKFNLPNAFAKK